MSRWLANLTLDTLAELPRSCRGCVCWELGPPAAAAVVDRLLEKEAWLSRILLEWGSCGKLAYLDGVPAGYVLYAPPAYLPGSLVFPTAPPSPDAILLATAAVRPDRAGRGLGRMLVQAAATDLSRRGARAVEAFGDTCATRAGSGSAAPAAPLAGLESATGAESAIRRGAVSGAEPAGGTELAAGRDRGPECGCVTPAGFLTAVGFSTIRPHHRYPRLRLELRPAAGWRSQVGYALEWLAGAGPGTPGGVAGRLGQPALVRLARSAETSIEPVGTSASAG